MTKRMLIDATHAEETRVVVLDGSKLEDFDVETSTKRQLKGNIYLAKIVRVEPSLQSAFVEYGGGRHGFLAFGEIHPDYYQIPVADRQRLLALQAEEARAAEEEDDEPPARRAPAPRQAAVVAPAPLPPTIEPAPEAVDEPADPAPDAVAEDVSAAGERPVDSPDVVEPAPDLPHAEDGPAQPAMMPRHERYGDPDAGVPEIPQSLPDEADPTGTLDLNPGETSTEEPPDEALPTPAEVPAGAPTETTPTETTKDTSADASEFDVPVADEPPPETVGGDADAGDGAEQARQRRESRFLRNYRIQEVIRRRQIMLVQVVKEERGTKGAALTTYISLAGRYSVLMPNSPRGGGISRKITSAADRRRLKEITAELEVPAGMGLIVRTAGANRPKPEIMRDCEYLMRLWDDIREHTMRSMAPALIYEEASLIKRAIRDVYSRDIDEIVVDGEEAWRSAHDFMRMLMPSHARKVQLWRTAGAETAGQPLFSKYQVDAQLDAMLSPTVQLKSGGYLVINQTEALVAIDVNSGRSTRERNIEETALRTNLEAADEAARQLRLRDLAGLIVIDFIDMESKRNNAAVERRMKEALKVDRARIQVGGISHFGLLEMSRQRLRPSFTETSFVTCAACGGQGHVRSTESSAVSVLRAIEDEGAKARASLVMVHVASSMVMYLLNHKRARLAELEARYDMAVQFTADEALIPPALRIDRLRPKTEGERPALAAPISVPVAPAAPLLSAPDDEFEDDDLTDAEMTAETARPAASAAQASGAPADLANATPAERAGEGSRRGRRRRRSRGGRREGGVEVAPAMTGDAPDPESGDLNDDVAGSDEAAPADVQPSNTQPSNTQPSNTQPAEAPLAEAQLDVRVGEALPAEAAPIDPATAEQPQLELLPAAPAGGAPASELEVELDENGEPKARRRGRRGGRRRRPAGETAEPGEAAAAPEPQAPAAEPSPAYPAYVGPTPADPFGGTGFDIFDMLDQAERASEEAAKARAAAAVVAPAALPENSELLAEPAPMAETAATVPEPQALVTEPEPQAPVTEPEPQALVTEPEPQALVTEPEPQALVTEPEPQALVTEPEPQALVTEPEPQALVTEPEPAEPQAPVTEPEPEASAVAQPVLVGKSEPAAEPKRGWWKR